LLGLDHLFSYSDIHEECKDYFDDYVEFLNSIPHHIKVELLYQQIDNHAKKGYSLFFD
jgi:hypothetical protein